MKHEILKIGHRGAKGHVAENTMASIEKALEFDVDGIEVDVHLATTGQLVVFHDVTLDRLTDGQGEVAKKSLKELEALKINAQYKIPTLLEVMDIIDHQCILNIELKGERTAFETCKSIQIYVETKGWAFEDFLVSSFNFEELQEVRDINKAIPLAVLTEDDIDGALDFARKVKANAIHVDFHLLSPPKVEQLQKAGFKVIAWTVNTPEDITLIKSYGVDGIISDFPDRL